MVIRSLVRCPIQLSPRLRCGLQPSSQSALAREPSSHSSPAHRSAWRHLPQLTMNLEKVRLWFLLPALCLVHRRLFTFLSGSPVFRDKQRPVSTASLFRRVSRFCCEWARPAFGNTAAQLSYVFGCIWNIVLISTILCTHKHWEKVQMSETSIFCQPLILWLKPSFHVQYLLEWN